MRELLELTVAEAIARISAGEVSADEYFRTWAEAAVEDELNAYLWRVRPRAPRCAGHGDGPPPGGPIAVKDNFFPQGIQTTPAPRGLPGYPPPHTAAGGRRGGPARGRG